MSFGRILAKPLVVLDLCVILVAVLAGFSVQVLFSLKGLCSPFLMGILGATGLSAAFIDVLLAVKRPKGVETFVALARTRDGLLALLIIATMMAVHLYYEAQSVGAGELLSAIVGDELEGLEARMATAILAGSLASTVWLLLRRACRDWGRERIQKSDGRPR